MKLSDSINYVLKKMARKNKNIYFILILTICTATVIGALYYRTTLLKRTENSIYNSIEDRSILVDKFNEPYDFSQILNIKYVADIYDTNYLSIGVTSETFKNEKYNGNIGLKYGSNNSLPKNIEGKVFNENDSGVAICPKYFYPSNDKKNYLDKNMFLTKEDILNKSFSIEIDIREMINEEIITTGTYKKKFKIIGVFDPVENYSSNNFCYISKHDIKEVYDTSISASDYLTIPSVVVVTDSIDKVEYVSKEIVKLGYQVTSMTMVDNKALNNIKYISNVIVLIAIFGIIILTLLYIDKKNLNNQKEIGVLKSMGYKKKDIKVINFIEMLFTTLISYLLGLILIGIIILIINIVFKNYLICNHIIIYHHITPYLIAIIIIIIIPLLTNYFYTYQTSKKKVIDILKEETL